MKAYMMRRYGRWLVLALAALALGVALVVWLPREAPTPSDAADRAVLQDSVETLVTRSAPGASPEPVEGAGKALTPGAEQSTISDRVEFIIRDASGKIKARQTTGGK